MHAKKLGRNSVVQGNLVSSKRQRRACLFVDFHPITCELVFASNSSERIDHAERRELTSLCGRPESSFAHVTGKTMRGEDLCHILGVVAKFVRKSLTHDLREAVPALRVCVSRSMWCRISDKHSRKLVVCLRENSATFTASHPMWLAQTF